MTCRAHRTTGIDRLSNSTNAIEKHEPEHLANRAWQSRRHLYWLILALRIDATKPRTHLSSQFRQERPNLLLKKRKLSERYELLNHAHSFYGTHFYAHNGRGNTKAFLRRQRRVVLDDAISSGKLYGTRSPNQCAKSIRQKTQVVRPAPSTVTLFHQLLHRYLDPYFKIIVEALLFRSDNQDEVAVEFVGVVGCIMGGPENHAVPLVILQWKTMFCSKTTHSTCQKIQLTLSTPPLPSLRPPLHASSRLSSSPPPATFSSTARTCWRSLNALRTYNDCFSPSLASDRTAERRAATASTSSGETEV